MSFRSSASFGKRQEYIAVAELLRLGHDVYMTLVDDQQIDCVIRLETDGDPEYLDIQIKARSKECEPTNAGRFAAMEMCKPRNKFFYIFYSEQAEMYWIVPSLDLIKEANRNKEGVNRGKYSINFCNVTSKGVTPRPRFRKYQDAFHLLTGQPEAQEEQTQNNLLQVHLPEIVPALGNQKARDPGATVKQKGPINFWVEVKKLEGLILKTLDQHKPFEITDVAENQLIITPQVHHQERPIPREAVEKAFKELVTVGELSRADIEKKYCPRSSAFVAALFANLPGVSYTVRPIILRYK